jgi:hypothetical protein
VDRVAIDCDSKSGGDRTAGVSLVTSLLAALAEVTGHAPDCPGALEVFRDQCDPAEFICMEEILSRLGGSLLRRPYLRLRHEGLEVAAGDYTERRQCVGHIQDGFADGGAIKALMAHGAHLELRHLAVWHRATRDLVTEVEAELPVAVVARAVVLGISPVGGKGVADTAGSLVVQLDGASQWQVNDHTGGSDACESLVLRPGDVLRLAPRCTHEYIMTAVPGLHLILDLKAPTPEDLIFAARRHFMDANADLFLRHHLIPASHRSEAVRDRFRATILGLDPENWRGAALALLRERVHANPDVVTGMRSS